MGTGAPYSTAQEASLSSLGVSGFHLILDRQYHKCTRSQSLTTGTAAQNSRRRSRWNRRLCAKLTRINARNSLPMHFQEGKYSTPGLHISMILNCTET